MIVLVLAVVVTAHCLTMQCNFQNSTWVQIGVQYSCRNPIITADGNLTYVFKVTGTHMSRRSNSDVRAFHASGYLPQLLRIPKGIDDFFPNLLHFGWQNGSLTSIFRDDFKTFPDLESISVIQNKLVAIDGDLFFDNREKLRYIDFSYNLLADVGKGLLSGLDKLTSAKFIGNKCVNATADTSTEIQVLKFWLDSYCPRPATTSIPRPTIPTAYPTYKPSTNYDNTTKAIIGIVALVLSLLVSCFCRYFCRGTCCE